MVFHGFYQDTDFKWNYKSHNGIFIPVILENKIQGLRILLDKEYELGTENIWFSSNNKYNGTKANNWPVILKSKDANWFEMYNTKNKTSIIIATEIILAHRLFNNSNKTVVGIPSTIDKDFIITLVNKFNVSEVFLYVDKYTLTHTSNQLVENIIHMLEEKNIKVNFRVAIDIDNIVKNLNNEELNNIKIA